MKGRLADGALKNAYADGTLPTAITVAHPPAAVNRDIRGLGGRQEHADHVRQRSRHLEGLQLVGVDGARSMLNLTNVRQRPTVIPLVAFAFCGVVAVAGCDSPPPPVAPESAQTTSLAPHPPAPVVPPSRPQALIDVLARLSDPAVPGADKIDLVELATADDAARWTSSARRWPTTAPCR